MSEYSELLKSPHWQKKRLQIMERDSFKCQHCMSTEKTLNVHHTHYIYGRDPWDYSNAYLITLCEKCHKREHELDKDFKSMDFYKLLKDCGVLSLYLAQFITAISKMNKSDDLSFHKNIHACTMALRKLEIGKGDKSKLVDFIQGKTNRPNKKKKKKNPRKRKTKDLKTFDFCRKCNHQLVKRKPIRKLKPKQTYYYNFYNYCPNCHTMFMLESEKVYLKR